MSDFIYISGPPLELIFQLFFAWILGFFLGLERWHLGKAAGARTFSLVASGACLFTVISKFGFSGAFDPSRVASQIVVGIGFMGMGVIIHHGTEIKGLTTAAGLWVAAGIGTAVGAGLYYLALTASIITFIVFSVVRVFDLETKLEKLIFSETREKREKDSWLTKLIKRDDK
jgi:putative Mg2+ transporter-C (MgtC) family protein